MTARGAAHAGRVVTVLGASGFVGSAVLAALAPRPYRVRAVARRPSAVPRGSAAVEVCRADLASGAVTGAVAGSDVVVCLVTHSGGWRAAESDPESERVNVGIMRELLGVLRAERSAGPPPLVVYAGAASQVGVPPRDVIDGTERDRPATEYDRQKLAAEELLMAASAEGVVRGVSLRLPTVFGEAYAPWARDRGVVSAMIRRALTGEPLTMWHDGTVKRDLVHVSDVADAFLAAVDRPEQLVGRHWLLGAGRGDRLGDVFRAVSRIVAERTGRQPVPVVSVEPPAHAPATDFADVTIDSSLFRAATGWSPRIALHEALDRTVAAMAEEF
ncbi:NAD-dependent epimerase/dehydratase family protein [Streptomyces hygroscopicus]|uniref:NAD-dependent epimerase/dehydratase family protein n=1 Tax=Streptomyces hygroscopicus TaxID=1912 RepID=UPI0036B2FEE5